MKPPVFRSEKDRLREAQEKGFRHGLAAGLAMCLVFFLTFAFFAVVFS